MSEAADGYSRHHMQQPEREIGDRDVMLGMLRQGRYVSIALTADDRPYIVTLSYGYDRNRHALYFHSGVKGLKLDIMAKNPRVCATLIEDRGYRMGECSHAYRSLLLYGSIRLVTDPEEQRHGLEVLLEHLEEDPEPIRRRSLGSDAVFEKTAVLTLTIEEMTAREGC
ncbi:pyridoxamine 5'-phosphate oxidase family protein [bacterium]|nr:pyridoxamine 5'-phosphate oxidase family protein [bacterium]